MISEFINYRKNVYFHGILITIPISDFPEQIVYIRNQEVFEDAHEEIKFQKIINEQFIIYLKEKNEINKIEHLLDFAKNQQLSISIVENNLHCLYQIGDVTSQHMEIFNPTLVFAYNSLKTYKRIRDEYYRVARISAKIKKILELNK
jgi:hypothetical protein